MIGYTCPKCDFHTDAAHCDDCDSMLIEKWGQVRCPKCDDLVVSVTCRRCGEEFPMV